MNLNTILVSIACSGLCGSSLLAQVALNTTATRVLGSTATRVVSTSPNLAEAKDLLNPNSVAVDTSASPPILYVADTGNNRVLGWRNAVSFDNGAPADLVLGQRDFNSTLAGGPGTQLSTGLNSPVAVAVDSQGNVYVADAGNNRILRYQRPFAQTDEYKIPDKVIGQANFTSNLPNAGATVAANTVALNLGGGRLFRSALVIDGNGNLWFSDAGNNRVLRYPLAALQKEGNQPAADVVIGQLSPVSNTTIPNNPNDPRYKQILSSPSGLAFDNAGRLYVCDAFGRVLVYTRPVNNSFADRVLGAVVLQPGQTPPPVVNDTGLGNVVNGRILPPEGVFVIGSTPFVIDTPSNRILRYDPYEAWPPESKQYSPSAKQVIGQADFISFKPNRNLPEASASGFNTPLRAAVANHEVYLVDGGNHRVMVFPIQGNTISVATRLLGQKEFYQTAPNNIDGREFFLVNGLTQVGQGQSSDGAGVVVDKTSTPPRLYVSDTYNHRILGFKDARSVHTGDRADIVIGQRDFLRAQINNPANDANQITDSGLFLPAGLAVDSGGNLYVADSGNGRVLRFARPFDQEGPVKPNLVLGKPSFFSPIIPDATPSNLSRPYGLAFSNDGHLLVSDMAQNRVLFFRKPADGDFTNGQAAEKVFGQPDFNSVTGSNQPNRMIAPHGISMDTDDRLYVCDTGNNRILIYDSVLLADVDPFPALPLTGVSSPHGIYVSPQTGEIWVTSPTQNAAYRFPVYLLLLLNPASNYQIPTYGPVAVTQDSAGNLILADSSNRVSFYYPGLLVSNGGNQLRRLSPFGYATLKPVDGSSFGSATVAYTDVPGTPPIPTTLGDLEVLVDGLPAPIQSVSPFQVNFIVPQAVQPSNNTEIILEQKSTGQVLAAATVTTTTFSPALFTVTGDGNGQLIAMNPGGVANSPVDRVGRSEVLSIFGTGFGPPPTTIDDGAATPEQAAGSGILRLVVATDFVPDGDISYFGLTPGMVGVWRIDFKVPDKAPPDPQVIITCQFNSIPCNQDGSGRIVKTYIAVKP
ncbi:MAG: Virginiamycin B lyase [Bryobacteraceae bacterium]|nr:Virginiamycin B lyase [Bryobacteraceae bacterium]